MKVLRISASLIGFSLAAALAACGGGGSGTLPNPGGGGGPTPHPTSSPTGSPTGTPTATPTATPTGTPSATPPPITTNASATVTGADGPPVLINGTDNWQTNGVTASEPGDGDTALGGNGSNVIDNALSCTIGTEPGSGQYHVHTFLGIYVNGQEMAVPDAIGMKTPDSNEPIVTFACAYNIHTHGASGIIHVEDPSIAGNWNTNPAVAPPAKYNFQAFLDVWGQSLGSIGGSVPLTGVYTGLPSGTAPGTNADLVTSYAPYTGALSSLLLQHHRAIWLVYGTPPAGGLPQVKFGISN